MKAHEFTLVVRQLGEKSLGEGKSTQSIGARIKFKIAKVYEGSREEREHEERGFGAWQLITAQRFPSSVVDTESRVIVI